MSDSYVIKPLLEAHRTEVKVILLAEYNEAEQMQLFKEDGRREGIIDTLISLVKDGILTVRDAALRVGVSEDVIWQKMTANASRRTAFSRTAASICAWVVTVGSAVYALFLWISHVPFAFFGLIGLVLGIPSRVLLRRSK